MSHPNWISITSHNIWSNPTPERIAYIFAALRLGYTVDEIQELTRIDRWFLNEMSEFIQMESYLRTLNWE